MPMDQVSFVHRVGRTGRAGEKGLAISFFTKEDVPIVRKMAELLKESKCKVPEWLFQIKQVGKNSIKKIKKRG